MRVLLVDDDPALLLALSEALERRLAGARVVTAESAESAIALLRTDHFDLIISDVLMSGLGGAGLAEALAAVPHHPPVVLITGATNVDPDRLPAGAAAVVAKPFTVGQLVDLLKTLLPPGSSAT